MSFAEALARLKNAKGPDRGTDKADGSPSVTNVSDQGRDSEIFNHERGGSKSDFSDKTKGSEKSETPIRRPDKTDKRPIVRCRDCQHFQPDHINPRQGLGGCRIGAAGDPTSRGYRLTYPGTPRKCGGFRPKFDALLDICRRACRGRNADPEDLAEWVRDQNEAQWEQPAALKRWAQLRGGGNE